MARAEIYFLTVLEAVKSKIRESAWSGSDEGSLPDLQRVAFLLSPQMVEREGVASLVSLLIKTLIPS